MKVVTTRSELAACTAGKVVGFVPTMGALHPGHLSLVRESRERQLFTVASIFVNPTQFNNAEDLAKYPRDHRGDIRLLEKEGCDVLFLPEVDEIYPVGAAQDKYLHSFGPIEQVLEGAFRPGHFRGMAQVVHILFELVRPHTAFFGEKDFQQLAIVRQLVKSCALNVEIVGMPTLRESDGLAMSSRNMRLNKKERQAARVLYRALVAVRDFRSTVPSATIEQALDWAKTFIDVEPLVRLEYFEIADSASLMPATSLQSAGLRALVAAHVGPVRLIDNLSLDS